MLALSGAEWEELRHAYGPASDIPPLLRDLAELPPCESAETEPYFTLWSSLCHQGDVYTASYAALPHLAMVCGNDPGQAHWSILQLAIAIELARLDGYGPTVPDSLAGAYEAAIQELPGIAVDMLRAQGTRLPTNIAAAALAVSNKQPRLAEAYFELDADTAEPFLEWFRNRQKSPIKSGNAEILSAGTITPALSRTERQRRSGTFSPPQTGPGSDPGQQGEQYEPFPLLPPLPTPPVLASLGLGEITE